ncbi:hypothetical protein JL721_4340 [Aureococcus anophagefferens]|nr:hypothetical protein JL721_4340 [Aureococcus anophagefferens]
MSAKKATVDAADLAKRLDIKAKLATPVAPTTTTTTTATACGARPAQGRRAAPAPAAPRDDDDATRARRAATGVVAALDARAATLLGLGAPSRHGEPPVFGAGPRQGVLALPGRRRCAHAPLPSADCGFEAYSRAARRSSPTAAATDGSDARAPSFDDAGDDGVRGRFRRRAGADGRRLRALRRQRDDSLALIASRALRQSLGALTRARAFSVAAGALSHPARLLRRATRAWQERRLSNFGYLLVANGLAGRSFADPCQYPVFPWVLADYSSEDLDLDDPRVYRDLAKPMGALNDARLRETVDRYEAFDDTYMPRFHYGSHYSTAAGVVVHYLLRTEPFGSLHCDLQGGRFDVADRLFASVAEAWDANSGARGEKSGSEVKELTPEWYCAPAFLTNRGRLPLGASQDGEAVGDAAAAWARGSPETFVRALRAALESDHASRHLHEWIDLVFGHKQRGPGAVDARNVFFYLCYDAGDGRGALDRAGPRGVRLRPLPARLCAISRDGTLVAPAAFTAAALRVSEFDLERGSDGAGPLCCAPPARRPLSRTTRRDAGRRLRRRRGRLRAVRGRAATLVLVGAATARQRSGAPTASGPGRARRGRGRGRVPGHAAPIVAGDASRAADVAVTAAADGRVAPRR